MPARMQFAARLERSITLASPQLWRRVVSQRDAPIAYAIRGVWSRQDVGELWRQNSGDVGEWFGGVEKWIFVQSTKARDEE